MKECEQEKKILGEALVQLQELKKIKDKKKLKIALDKLPDDLKSEPYIVQLRNENFVKTESSGKDLVIYCGNTIEQWNPKLFKTKGFGGSEEAVIHLAREYAKLGWNVTVYNNCGHKTSVDWDIIPPQSRKEIPRVGLVTYRPFWEFNLRDKQDVVILWRWAKPLDADINAPKVFLDLHDVIPEGELTEKRLAKVSKIFVKSKFHRSLFPNVPDDKFAIVPNGLEIYPDKTIKKDPYLIINTSSPDRSMDVMPKLFKEIKKQVPKAKMQWCYGWEGFKSAHSNDSKKMAWMEETKKAIKESGIEDLGKLSQEEVGKLYQKASIFAYPTEFAEIDCISVKKANAAHCYSVTTDFGALFESVYFGSTVHSTKTKDNWNRPYQFHFGLEDEEAQKLFVTFVVNGLKLGETKVTKACYPAVDERAGSLSWNKIAERWNKEFV